MKLPIIKTGQGALEKQMTINQSIKESLQQIFASSQKLRSKTKH